MTAKRFRFDQVKRPEKLPRKEQQELIHDLVDALVLCRTTRDVIAFLQDLLTLKETRVLSKRLRIAKLLLQGVTYEEIEEELHTSHGTVAKIAAWLSERGDGFREIIAKLPKVRQEYEYKELSDWDKLKRRYPLYFWPELLLEEIVKSASKRQKDRMKDILETLEEKNKLHREIEKLLKYSTT